ncbi:hypothetical protein [Pedobacter sp. MC2016-24]|uniref:hypothetical protein n=1 Tax=Pedobacter sp. MC2016-24 TaxID=2780090 RepID=UPI00187EFF30|nr:hypothetical protein [Pedobacter sp. MC2016-24]MBE9602925.1 hypothetical protein [Pedobacter sp. MC2016-24]
MKKQLLACALSVLVFMAGCSKNPTEVEEPTGPTTGVVEVSTDIAANTTWTADKIYLLKGNIFVTGNTTLTIEPGTIIKGDKASKGSLIISRGAKIMAVGTVEKPIVFTSSQASGARAPGDWGGVILLGKGVCNNGTSNVVEGIPASVGDKALYGGTDNADNSGKLKYVRIEFAGIPLLPDVEINGLTLAGVGSGTELDYIQVYRSGDDAFEFFGGSVNAKHLLAIGTWDDDFDTDNGYSGKVQFALAQRAQVVADVSGSNGFESDNNSAGSDASPVTSAIFSNVTIVGPQLTATSASGINANFQHVAQIRRNSSMSLFNSVLTNYPEGIFIDDERPATGNNSTMNFASGAMGIKNNLIYGCNVKGNQIKFTPTTDVTALARQAAVRTSLTADNSFVPGSSVADLLTDPLKYGLDFKASGNANAGTPDFTVKAGSAAAAGALFTDAKLAGLETVAYKGAFGSVNWAAGWAHFDPQTLAYTTPGAVK